MRWSPLLSLHWRYGPVLPFYHFDRALLRTQFICKMLLYRNQLAVVAHDTVSMHAAIGFDWDGIALLRIWGDRSGVSCVHILDRPRDEGTHARGD